MRRTYTKKMAWHQPKKMRRRPSFWQRRRESPIASTAWGRHRTRATIVLDHCHNGINTLPTRMLNRRYGLLDAMS